MALTPRLLLRGAAVAAAAFVALLGFAYASPGARWLDASALQGFLGLQRPSVNPVAEWLVHLGDPRQVIAAGAVLAAIALLRARPRMALLVVALIGLTSVSSQSLKALLAYPRHDGSVDEILIQPAAFPSGHATAVMTLALCLVLVMPPRLRLPAAALGASVTLAVSYSVVALGWHFPSDIAGGYLLAGFWALVLVAGLRAAAARWPERTGRGVLTAATRSAVERVAAVGMLAALAVLAGAIVVAAGAIVLFRLDDLVGYMQAHTAFFAVAAGLAVAAVAVLAVLATVLQRRA